MIGIVMDYFVRVDENPNLSFISLIGSAFVKHVTNEGIDAIDKFTNAILN